MVFSPTGKLFRLQALGLSISLAVGSTALYAAEDIQFNMDVLDVNDRENIDLSQFSRGGYIMPGVYNMAVHINKNELPEENINFYPPEDDPASAAGRQQELQPQRQRDGGGQHGRLAFAGRLAGESGPPDRQRTGHQSGAGLESLLRLPRHPGPAI
jgi:hypothetical protein